MAISCLEKELRHMVSGDEEGFVVLWHVRNEEPMKIFSITGNIKSINMFGKRYCEALYICANNKVLRL